MDSPTIIRSKLRSIRFKLLISFMTVIIMLLLLSILFLVMHVRIVYQYKEVTDNIILENKFTQLMPEFIQTYFNLISSPNNAQMLDNYQEIYSEINYTMAVLDERIVNKDSQLRFRGLKNVVKTLVLQCDGGLKKATDGDIVSAISDYEYVFSKQPVITQSTNELLAEELKYAEKLHDDIQKTNMMGMVLLVTLSVLVSVGCIIYAVAFSKKLADPLIELSLLTKDIAQVNDFSKMAGSNLVERSDEIGTLSRSFNSMVLELRSKMEFITKKDNQIIYMNQRLEITNQKLVDMDKHKDEFISIAAHELKTPLTSIKGFSQLLKNTKILKSKKLREHYLSLIDKDSDRLSNLILDLVDSSRLSLGQLKINVGPTDVNEIYEDITMNMQKIIKDKGLIPKFSIEKGMPKIIADKERVLQVLRNLITNSVKFTEKGSVSIAIIKKQGFVQFEVKDTGKGIPKEKQGFIFSKFYQVDGSFTRQFGGSGLGLSICKGIVDIMKGKIWFESEEGKGSTFYFIMPTTLPADPPSGKDKAQTVPPTSPTQSSLQLPSSSAPAKSASAPPPATTH